MKITIFSATDKEAAPVIIFFPAMGVRAEFYQPLGKEMSAAGIHFVSADLRGLGTSSVRPSKQKDFGYKEMIEDVETIVQHVKNQYPNQKLYLMGHSLGGQLASLYLGKHPKAADGLILVAACSIYYKGWQGGQKWKILMGIRLFPILSQLFGYFPGDKVGFGGIGAKTVMLDWGHVGKTGKYTIANDAFNYEKGMQDTKLFIFAASIEKDWMAPKLAIQNLYKKFHPETPVRDYELSKEATGVSLNHFNWVKNSALLVTAIEKWLTQIR